MPNTDHQTEEPLRDCPGCHREFPRQDIVWTHDKYGNPWKLCCNKCEPRVSSEVAGWNHDPAYTGEALEAEDF